MTPPDAPLQWLTPAEIRRPPFRQWLFVPAGLALGVCFVADLVDRPALQRVGQACAVLAAIPMAWWVEGWIFGRLGDRRAATKLAVLGLLGTCGCCVPLMAVAVVSSMLPKGFRTFADAYGMAFVWWVCAAGLGSALVVAVDRSVSAWRARFPTRLTAAILFLIAVALQLAMAASVLSAALISALTRKAPGVNVSPAFGMSEAELRQWMVDNPERAALAIFVAVFLAALPAVVSASAKLAEAAMERVRPMAKAFALVSQGTRTVRVEEAGSIEFIELAQSFNRLVAALDATERMERAFGRYVSGQVLSRIKAQHGQAELAPQLREATVFFADIRGFTSLSEKLNPEQVVTFLNGYLARVVAQVDAHEGYLNKFIGDAVVVVFNGPVDQPDHAERAVKCARALQAEVAKINAEGVLPEVGELRIGVGVATGPMVCGNVGGPTQMEYTVIGDTVNLSARLTSLAQAGEVWVSEATAAAAPGFQYSVLPEVKLKGKEKPVAPRRVEGP